MLTSEVPRNPNQRVVPLSSQLINDMLEYEGREYQSPHKTTNEDDNSLKRKSSISEMIRNKFKDPSSSDESENESETSSLNQILYNEGQLKDPCPSRSFRQFRSNTDLSYTRLKEKLDSKRFSAESCQSLACFHIRNSSSDSTLPISSRNTEQYSTGMHNFFDMKQLWINTIIASKSRTSFQLNRKKLDKFSPRCNANYNNIPDTQDLLFEQQALVSLMSGQRSRSKRNSRNVHR